MTPPELHFEEIHAPGMDTINVYWHDVGEGQGHVTITCWGCAWTCYFNSMPEKTIRQFFAAADVDYLVTKLGITQHLQQRKRDFVYLEKIVTAVRNHLRQEVPTA